MSEKTNEENYTCNFNDDDIKHYNSLISDKNIIVLNEGFFEQFHKFIREVAKSNSIAESEKSDRMEIITLRNLKKDGNDDIIVINSVAKRKYILPNSKKEHNPIHSVIVVPSESQEDAEHNYSKIFTYLFTGFNQINDFKRFTPEISILQRFNKQDNESVRRIILSSNLMKNYYSPSFRFYQKGVYRIVTLTFLNSIVTVKPNQKSLINGIIIINNQQLLGYFLNNSIFKSKAILREPYMKASCHDAFINLLSVNPEDVSPLTLLSNTDCKNAATQVAAMLNWKNCYVSPYDIAKQQLKLAYSQDIIISDGLQKKIPKLFKQKSGKYIYEVFWKSCSGEFLKMVDEEHMETNLKYKPQTINLKDRLKNGLNVLETIEGALMNLWISSFCAEYEQFNGLVLQTLNTIVINLFGLNRLIGDEINLENITLKPELEQLSIEFGGFVKRIIENSFETTSQEGLKILSIMSSTISPTLISSVTDKEFNDIHFGVFYAIDRLFNDPTFSKMLFLMLLAYHDAYTCGSSMFVQKRKLKKQFPFDKNTIVKYCNGNDSMRYSLRSIMNDIVKNDTISFNNYIDVANILTLTPYTIIFQTSISKKAEIYRCYKILSILEGEPHKTAAITYLNNIWKSNIMKLPWTSFALMDTSVIYGRKSNVRVDAITSRNVYGRSIREDIEMLLKQFHIFNPYDASDDSMLKKDIKELYGSDYEYVYFNRFKKIESSIEELRISFRDVRFGNGFLYSVSANEPDNLLNNPVVGHYSTIPEMEYDIVSGGDSKMIPMKLEKKTFKVPYLNMVGKDFHTHYVVCDTGDANGNATKSTYEFVELCKTYPQYVKRCLAGDGRTPSNKFYCRISFREISDVYPVIKYLDGELRTNIKPIK